MNNILFTSSSLPRSPFKQTYRSQSTKPPNREKLQHCCQVLLCLAKVHGALLAGAGLEGLVEEAAGLLVALVDLEAFVEHLLVLGAGSLEAGGRSSGGLLLDGGSILDRSGGLVTATRESAGGGTDGAVGDGRAGTEGHALGNGRADAGEHAAGLLLRNSGRSGGLRGGGGSRSRLASGCRRSGGGPGSGLAAEHRSASASSS